MHSPVRLRQKYRRSFRVTREKDDEERGGFALRWDTGGVGEGVPREGDL